MTDVKPNLYQRIQSVANDVKNISKNMTVGKGAYSYKAVSDLDVTLKVKEAEKKHGIVSIPTRQELIHQEIIRTVDTDKDRSRESLKYSFQIKMTTRIVNLDNPTEYLDIESFGHGLDSADKGFGKASTYARKYALLNAYKIATGEDPDNEPSKKMQTKKNDELRNKVINILLKDQVLLVSVLKWANTDDVNSLSDEQIRQTATSLKNNGKL